jgi:hypothetical protein
MNTKIKAKPAVNPARTIIHLAIGDDTYSPEQSVMDDYEKHFKEDPVFVCTTSLSVTAHNLPADGRGYQIIVQAGDDNWTPSPEEVNDLIDKFDKAAREPLGGIVVTRHSVRALIHLLPCEKTNLREIQ